MLAVLAAPLDPRGFTSGDSGVKLIAARTAATQPSRPLAVALPKIGNRQEPFVDRFFTVHGDHTHALQSPLFPLITAPLLVWGGLRAIYVAPIASFVLLWWILTQWSRLRGWSTDWALASVSLAANPLTFYAFEYSEHVPAAAMLAASLTLGLQQWAWSGLFSGVVAGLAVLSRPEAIWWALLWGAIGSTPRLRYFVGVSVVLAGFATLNHLEGAPLSGHHAAANLAALGDQWLPIHVARARLWLLPSRPWLESGIALLGSAWLSHRRGSESFARLLGLVGSLVLAGGRVAGAYSPDSLWFAFPIAGLLLIPGAVLDRRLAWLVGLSSLGVLLSSTHDGGTQWGPRILLIASPGLMILAAQGLRAGTAPGPWLKWRLGVAVVIVACGIWTSRQAYVELRGWKRYYGTLASSVERATLPGDYVVTTTWWLDQVCAYFYPTRTFLVADSSTEALAILRALEGAGVNRIRLAWSNEPGQGGPVPLEGSCYRMSETHSLAERAVVLATASCDTVRSPGLP